MTAQPGATPAAVRQAGPIIFTSGEVNRYYDTRVPRLKRLRKPEWRGPCPIHQGKDDNFAVRAETGLWHCHSACGRGGDILDLEMELTGADFKTAKVEVFRIIGRDDFKPREVATYDYTDGAGRLLFQAVRLEPKAFKQRRPDGRGGWIWDLKGVQRVLYRLPELLRRESETVFVVEGEKDVHSLEAFGLLATCNPMGAGKWRPEYSETLRGRSIVFLPDNDGPGRAHMAAVAADLLRVGCETGVVELPGLPEKGDVSDWIAAGGTIEQFQKLVEAAEPLDATALRALRARWEQTDDRSAGQATNGHAATVPIEPQPQAGLAEAGHDAARPPDLLSQPFNDYGNAQRVMSIYRETMRFCHASESWMHWQGGRWAGDEDGRARLHSQNTIAEFGKQALTINNAAAAKFAASCLNSQRITNALREAAPHLAVTLKELDRDPFLFNVLNGVIELRTGNLREHRREDYITKLAPVTYDPTARSALWERALDEWTGGNKELRDFLQRAVGYSLSGDTSEEVLFFVHGPARAGKSSFLEAVKATMGDYAKTADFDAFVQRKDSIVRSDIAELSGRRFVVSIEVDEGKRLAEGLVKMLTGGDTVRARFLYQEGFEFIPQFKLWLAANHAPKVRDDDTAMWRRILRIPFENVIPIERRDPTLKARLKNTEEIGPAILAWAVEGFLRWQDDRLQIPEIVSQATEQYRQDMDPLRQFFDDRCIFGDALKVTAKLLHEEYENWCRENGAREINGREFSQRLRDRNCTPNQAKILGKNTKVWQGIGVTCGEAEP